jgi:hypothetical protein
MDWPEFSLRDPQTDGPWLGRSASKLYAKEELHAGLVIIVPQVLPAHQRELFDAVLAEIGPDNELLNEVIEITLSGDVAELTRYALPELEY